MKKKTIVWLSSIIVVLITLWIWYFYKDKLFQKSDINVAIVYDENWQPKQWEEFNYYDDEHEHIRQKTTFKDWMMHWEQVDYYPNWNIERIFYLDHQSRVWKEITYTEDWTISTVTDYWNWKWDISEFTNYNVYWMIYEHWFYKNAKMDWERITYDWDRIISKKIYENWELISSEYF